MSKHPLPPDLALQQLLRRARHYRRRAERAATEEIRRAMVALAMRYEKQAAELTAPDGPTIHGGG